MGLDITVLMADWRHLARIPPGARMAALDDAAYPPFCCAACEEEQCRPDGGWVWPRGQEPPWCAEYRFVHTTGSYGWHFRLGNAWEDVRDRVAPDLRDALDTFLCGLFWDGPYTGPGTETDDGPPAAAGFPGDPEPWRPDLLLLCPPDGMPALAGAWRRAEPRLEELRTPFDTVSAGWAGRPDSFDAATALLREWGAIVTAAAHRGWGLIGLPY
ncbi:secretory pathway Sec39 family protein [Streptomyces sp. RFCAC02]|uniref:secretory pathway Sec39 family protein n=1 Tax=Streptomyces sp. RFCAC02 TaxID=2499143 RepID=UPI001F0DECD3|nr:secretory pathway Sec39 family protein [Streptomyces sp. RFCAC02]